jgi:hypothetical protein
MCRAATGARAAGRRPPAAADRDAAVNSGSVEKQYRGGASVCPSGLHLLPLRPPDSSLSVGGGGGPARAVSVWRLRFGAHGAAEMNVQKARFLVQSPGAETKSVLQHVADAPSLVVVSLTAAGCPARDGGEGSPAERHHPFFIRQVPAMRRVVSCRALLPAPRGGREQHGGLPAAPQYAVQPQPKPCRRLSPHHCPRAPLDWPDQSGAGHRLLIGSMLAVATGPGRTADLLVAESLETADCGSNAIRYKARRALRPPRNGVVDRQRRGLRVARKPVARYHQRHPSRGAPAQTPAWSPLDPASLAHWQR